MKNEYILKRSAYYYYHRLTPKNKKLYEMLLKGLIDYQPRVNVKGMGYISDDVSAAMDAIRYDRPDIFWSSGHSYYTLNGIVEEVEYTYSYTKTEVDSLITRLVRSSFYTNVMRLLTTAKNNFERALRLYEYIIKHCQYDDAAMGTNGNNGYRYAFNLTGVMLYGKAVCAGYARTFQYFANKFDIYCTYVSGNTVRGSHGWNLIKLDGDYYYIDATWGDPTFTNRAFQDPDHVSYDYFCFTTKDMLKSHRAVLKVPMPECTATRYNYHVYFGLMATVYSLADITNRISRAVQSGSGKIEVRYASRLAYDTALDRLIRKQEIYSAMRSAGVSRYGYNENSISYTDNSDNLTLTVNLKRI